METSIKNIERILDLTKGSKGAAGKSLQENLDLIYEELTSMHVDYTGRLHKILEDYLKLPHSRALQQEVIGQLKERMVYLRKQAQEMDAAFNKDNLPGLQNEVLNFLSAVKQYTIASSGIFLNDEEIATDILDYMNESAFTLKEQYKFKYPSVSMKYKFRKETGKLIGDDLGYKLYLVHKTVKREWEQLSLAFRNCR